MKRLTGTSRAIAIAIGIYFGSFAGLGDAAQVRDSGAPIETLVFVRHGEKPLEGNGQITCQGLNRALALPPVLVSKFGRAEFIFAPDPKEPVRDPSGMANYVRPLATIEPTAVALGLPVNTQFGFTDITGLENELLSERYGASVIYVAWEHTKLAELVRHLVKRLGSDAEVPNWAWNDYDSIYVVRIDSSGAHKTVRFSVDHENLDGRPTTCP